jgi:hypothetical protein
VAHNRFNVKISDAAGNLIGLSLAQKLSTARRRATRTQP